MPLYAEARTGTIPERALNGGLYTGQAFDPGSPWGNVPIVPDANNYIQTGLSIGNKPPPGVEAQTFNSRPGSTHAPEPGMRYVKVLNMMFPDTCNGH